MNEIMKLKSGEWFYEVVAREEERLRATLVPAGEAGHRCDCIRIQIRDASGHLRQGPEIPLPVFEELVGERLRWWTVASSRPVQRRTHTSRTAPRAAGHRHPTARSSFWQHDENKPVFDGRVLNRANDVLSCTCSRPGSRRSRVRRLMMQTLLSTKTNSRSPLRCLLAVSGGRNL